MTDNLNDLVDAFEKGKVIPASGGKKPIPEAAKAAPGTGTEQQCREIPFPIPNDLLRYLGGFGCVFAFADQRAGKTVLLDMADDEPRTAVLEDLYSLSADVHPSSGWLFTGKRKDAPTAVIVADPFKAPRSRRELPSFEDDRRLGFSRGLWIGDEPVLWAAGRHPYPWQLPSVPWHPLAMDGEGFRTPEGLPPVNSAVNLRVCLAKAVLGDGRTVLVWNGKGYELQGKGFIETFDLEITRYENLWTCVPSGQDGFYYLEARKLFEIHRGRKPVPHAPKVANIMSVASGPGGTLLLQLGENKARNLGVLYDPSTGETTPVGPKVFKSRHGVLDSLEALCHSEAGGRLIGVQKGLYTLPLSAIGAPAPSPAPRNAAAPTAGRRFEFVEGSASKFWEVSREGKSMTVRFGKVGTDGQTKTKTFADDETAQREVETLIREKTGKGYREKT